MKKENKKCKNCYFEDGEHSFECEDYLEMEQTFPIKEQPKDWEESSPI